MYRKFRRYLIGTGAVAAISVVVYIAVTSVLLNRVTSLSNGISICFDRLYNSYTQKIIPTGVEHLQHSYLQQSFFYTTEECIAETITYLEKHFRGEVLSSMSELNAFSVETSNFHKLLGQNNSGKFTEGSIRHSLNRKYGSIVSIKDGIQSRLDANSKSLSTKLKTSYVLISVLAILVLILAFLRPRDVVKDIVVEDDSPNDHESSGPVAPVAPVSTSNEIPNFVRPYNRDTILLDVVISHVQEVLSDMAQEKRVQFDFSIDSNLEVYGHAEEMEQSLYSMLYHFIEGNKEEGSCSLKVDARKFQDEVLVAIESSGYTFDKAFLDGQGDNTWIQNITNNSSYSNICISGQLARDNGVVVSFSNSKIGGQAHLRFPCTP